MCKRNQWKGASENTVEKEIKRQIYFGAKMLKSIHTKELKKFKDICARKKLLDSQNFIPKQSFCFILIFHIICKASLMLDAHFSEYCEN